LREYQGDQRLDTADKQVSRLLIASYAFLDKLIH
jgi:hypothetical protein